MKPGETEYTGIEAEAGKVIARARFSEADTFDLVLPGRHKGRDTEIRQVTEEEAVTLKNILKAFLRDLANRGINKIVDRD